MKSRDLDAARRSLPAFAAMVGHPLTDWQAAAFELRARVTCILAPRQSGKSRSLALLALWWAFRRAEQRVLIVSAGEDASRRLLAMVRRFAVDSPLLARSVLDEQASLLTLSNGSTIKSVPASERAIRGESVDLLLVDEAALVSDDVALGAAFPTTAARPDARIVLASTPWAEGGAFFEHVNAGDSEHVRVHRWSLDDCAWISSAAIEAARQSMPAARFAAEFEARWSSSLDQLFSRRVLELATADLDLPPYPPPPARILGGVDWGVVHDRSAVAWIARAAGVAQLNDHDPREPLYIVSARAWAPGEPLSNVAREIAAAPSHWAMLSSESTGVGAGPTQELFRELIRRPFDAGGGERQFVMYPARQWHDLLERSAASAPRPFEPPRPLPARGFVTIKNAVATSAQSKALVYERLRWLMDRGQIVLPRDADLLRELAALRLELRPGGGEKIEAGIGHDDLPDSIMIAAGVQRLKRGGLRCQLADLAAKPRPEAEVPELREPIIETGAKLRLYRRPPLQSVAGDELTLPADVSVRDRAAEERAAFGERARKALAELRAKEAALG